MKKNCNNGKVWVGVFLLCGALPGFMFHMMSSARIGFSDSRTYAWATTGMAMTVCLFRKCILFRVPMFVFPPRVIGSVDLELDPD